MSGLNRASREMWAGFSGAFRSIVRVIEAVMPEEFAWAIIYLFFWMGFVSLAVWVASG